MQKKFKIAIAFILCFLLLGALIMTSFVSNRGYKMPFYNFESYMDNQGKKEINKTFSYSEYSNASELEQLILDDKVASGIATTSLVVKLANKGYLQKIDYSQLFPELKGDISDFFTDSVNKEFALYDDFFEKGEHLYDYMVPYYFQERVVAYNINRGNNSGKELKFPDKSWSGILKTLSNNGYNRLGVTNNVRDNLIMGSSISGKATGKVTKQNYKNQVNGFINTINADFSGNKHFFSSDGTQILLSIIDPRQNTDSAILYNGDALDAYNEQNSFPNKKKGEDIRIVIPDQTSFSLDGLIIVNQKKSHASEKTINQFYENIYDGVFEGAINFKENNTNSAIYNNFNYVKYTPSFNQIYKYLIENEFNSDLTERNIFDTLPPQAGRVPIPMSQLLESIVNEYYNKSILQ